MSAERELSADENPPPSVPANPRSLTLLRACDTATGSLTGAHMGKSFSGPAYRLEDYPGAFLFHAETVAFADVSGLAAAMAAASADGTAAVVRGEPSRTGVAMRRLANAAKDRRGKMDPATLADEPREWLWLDADGIPNLPRVDPRTNPEQALGFLLSLMPEAIRRAALAWDWSSKCAVPFRKLDRKTGALKAEWDGVGPPPDLRAHLTAVLDRGVGWREGKLLLERVRHFVADRLEARGFATDPAAAYVDWKKTTEAQALTYLAAPAFLDGAEDPFPGAARRGLTEGATEVRMDDLLAELDAADAARTRVVPGAPTAAPKAARGPARTCKADRPAASPQVIPLAMARRRLEANEALTAGRFDCREARAKGLTRLYESVIRYVCELPELIGHLALDRRARGEADPAWRDWAAAGGVPEGMRDCVANIVGSAVCLSLQPGVKAPLPRAEVRAEILSALAPMMDADWLEDSWVGRGYDAAVLDRYEKAVAGEIVEYAGRLADTPIYVYGKDRIRRELALTDEECVRLGFWALATERARSALRREKAGAAQIDDVKAERRAMDPDIACLRAEGLSKSEIARRLGLPRVKVQRALLRIASAPASVAADAPAATEALPAAAPAVEAAEPVPATRGRSRALGFRPGTVYSASGADGAAGRTEAGADAGATAEAVCPLIASSGSVLA